ncbi:MAG: CNNM domain-containing protein, partial [Fimbriimonadaceae bacterium]|nr:CNNM domain-containing protein [Fimbriimonadaceae bacterium]
MDFGKATTSVGLILLNAFFVAAEYALVGARRNAIELLAQKGDRRAKLLLGALDNMAPYVAGVQVCITMLGIGIGLVAEPFISDLIKAGLDLFLDAKTLAQLRTPVSIFSVAVITYFTVVFG